jgi:hypothetical protein
MRAEPAAAARSMLTADSAAVARCTGPPATPSARPLPQRAHAASAPPAAAATALGDVHGGAPLACHAGFAIHQLLAARLHTD